MAVSDDKKVTKLEQALDTLREWVEKLLSNERQWLEHPVVQAYGQIKKHFDNNVTSLADHHSQAREDRKNNLEEFLQHISSDFWIDKTLKLWYQQGERGIAEENRVSLTPEQKASVDFTKWLETEGVKQKLLATPHTDDRYLEKQRERELTLFLALNSGKH